MASTRREREAVVDGVGRFSAVGTAAGCSVKAVQHALGHESATVTLNTYAHLWPDDDDRIRSAIGAYLRPTTSEVGVAVASLDAVE
jgi:hypothetical protein